MLKKADISSELKAISPVVEKLPIEPVFTVPEGYFAQFPEKLMQRIRKEENQDVSAELEEISPLLAARLTRKMPFTLPDGYFSETILPTAAEKPQAPVLPMYPVKRNRILYAAAAMAALVGLFSLFYLVNHNQQEALPTVNVSAELPKLNASELNSYLLTSPDDDQAEPLSLAGLEEIDFESLIDEVNDKELSEFLIENPSLRIETLN
jgi:hypothetical protein